MSRRNKREEEDPIVAVGRALWNAGKAQEAVEHLRTSEKAVENMFEYWRILAGAEEDLGNRTAALQCCQEAVRLRPRNELASRALFHILWDLGQEGDYDSEAAALAEIRRFLEVGESEWYERIIEELHEAKDDLWPAPDERTSDETSDRRGAARARVSVFCHVAHRKRGGD